MYAKVIDGQVVQVGLPRAGVINGRTVSNCHLLPEAALLAEGWLPLELNQPEYNSETHDLKLVEYVIETDKVIANYEIIPRPLTSEEQIEILDNVIGELLEVILPALL